MLLVVAVSPGCGRSVPAYTSSNFRTDVEALIQSGEYHRAVALLESADPARQAAHDKSGYLAVGEDLVVLPGVDTPVSYDSRRDWVFPGTSDVVEDVTWQHAATEFARRYNEIRQTE